MRLRGEDRLLGCFGQKGSGGGPPWLTFCTHSYNLSCELEPPSELASTTLKAKKSTAIVKRWSEYV